MKTILTVAFALSLGAPLPVFVIQRVKIDNLTAENARLQQAGWDGARSIAMSEEKFDQACFAKHWW